MHYESYVKRGMPSLSLAYYHQCPYSRPKGTIVSYAWQSSRACTKAHQEQEPSSYLLLQLSADSSVICSAICSIFRLPLCVELNGHNVPLFSISFLIKGSMTRLPDLWQMDRWLCNRRSAVTRQMPSSVMQRQGQILDALMSMIGQGCCSNPVARVTDGKYPKSKTCNIFLTHG